MALQYQVYLRSRIAKIHGLPNKPLNSSKLHQYKV